MLGIGGGSLEITLLMPLLTWKISKQQGRKLPTSVRGWYRGLLAQASSVAPITALQVVSNGLIEKAITGANRESTDSEKIMASCGAGVVSACIYSPVDLITIQQQKLGEGPLYSIKHIASNHGLFGGLYRGFTACAVREGIYSCGYLGLAPVFTSFLREKYPQIAKKSDFLVSLAGAISAGLIAAAITHPVDTTKTCIQGDLQKTKYRTAISTFFLLLKENGIRSIYKGAVPRSTRLIGAYIIVSYCREKAIQYKTNLQNKRIQ
uniref:Mitochondrial carrier protein n=1 Tax=Arcella intermedia TaxID=1963864 RepID=A0A6B2LE80_9EUKA